MSVALVLEVQVVAGHARHRLGVEAGEARDPVVLMDDDVAGPQVAEAPEEAAPLARGPGARLAAVDQPVLGEGGELEARGDEAVAEVGLGEDQPGRAAVEARLQARQVVGGPLGGATLRPGDDGGVAGAGELLQLRLGLLEAAGGEVGGLAADLGRLVGRDAGQADRGAVAQGLEDAVGLDVEAVGVLVVEGDADVGPVVAQARLDVLVGRDHDLRGVRDQVEQLAEAVDGQQLGDVRALVVGGGDLRQLAVLGRELGGGRDLDHVGLAEAALAEGAEPPQRVDLDVEEVDADGALLGGGIDVEQPAADGELAALLDLVDALVAGGHEVARRLAEVEQVALAQREAVRAQLRVGDLLGERDGGHDHHGLLRARRRVGQRVERGDPQAHEVGGRREVRLVRDAAARVVADGARPQPGPEVLCEVARRAVVARHHHGRPAHVAVGQRREHERPQRLADECRTALVGQLGGRGVVIEVTEEAAERQGSTESTKRGGPGC